MRDYWLLVRPRVLAFVILSVAAAAFSTAARPFPLATLLHTLVGSGLLTAGALALNQWWELQTDSLMPRTALRPLPGGRLSPRRAGWFGGVLSVLGTGYVAAFIGPTYLLGVTWLAWLMYLGVYTPLKTRSSWQTPVGALAGAMPVLIGAAAVDSLRSPLTWNLFGILYSWQLPHAMAVAWLYREQFAAAGIKLATVVDPSGRGAAAMACLGALATWVLGIAPAAVLPAGWSFAIAAFALGAGYFAVAYWFALQRNDVAARWLLRTSLIYLLLLWAFLAATKIFWR